MVFRRDALTATMSDYLVRAIAATSNIRLRTSSEVIDGGGAGHLEWVTVRHGVDYETPPATALFVMIGAHLGQTGCLRTSSAIRAGIS
jgi:thioredoxin reductase (NADPH)